MHCEQNRLCIYCESKIDITHNSSHFEHIKPKSLDVNNLTFDYDNLAISCNGNAYNDVGDKTRYNCGHPKDNSYDESKFLDPTKDKNIREYFKYDYDDFKITPTEKDSIKAQYMIDILSLNNPRLIVARKTIYHSFRNKIAKIKDINKRNAYLKKILVSETVAFTSFFRFKYPSIILK